MPEQLSDTHVRRVQWLRAHWLQYALLLGSTWGLTMGFVWWLLVGEPLLRSTIFWLIVGCVFTGPIVALRNHTTVRGGQGGAGS